MKAESGTPGSLQTEELSNMQDSSTLLLRGREA